MHTSAFAFPEDRDVRVGGSLELHIKRRGASPVITKSKLQYFLIPFLVVMCFKDSQVIAGEPSSLDDQNIYEGLLLFDRHDSTKPNPKLFRELKAVCLVIEDLPARVNVNSKTFERQLMDCGLKLVSVKEAQVQNLPIISLDAVKEGNRFLCTISVEDVVALSRQPSRKYRLNWWKRFVKTDKYSDGFQKLLTEFIASIPKKRER